MEWSAASATNAYLDTLKLCKKSNNSWRTPEPESNEFISALAAGMKAKLIVEVTSGVSPSTIALAAAARQTGGRLVCILPEPILAESKRVIKDSGLKDMVEFRTGDPHEILPNYENIDFSLIDCRTEDNAELLKWIDVNPRTAVVVANNLERDRNGFVIRGVKDRVFVRSTKHPIGKGMEITTMIGGERERERERNNEIEKRDRRGDGGPFRAEGKGGGGGGGCGVKRTGKSKWVIQIDEESGEEHIFRLPKSL